jgi:hypothetical protein
VAEQFVAFGEKRYERSQFWILLGQRARDFLGAEVGQPCLAAGDHGVQLPQSV